MAELDLHDVTLSPTFLQLARQRAGGVGATGAANSSTSGGQRGDQDELYAFKCALPPLCILYTPTELTSTSCRLEQTLLPRPLRFRHSLPRPALIRREQQRRAGCDMGVVSDKQDG